MTKAWQILRDAGLPLAIQGTGRGAPDREALASSIREAIAEAPTGRDAEALAAFIFAWHHHWPPSFAASLGKDGDAVLAWAAANTLDAGRYIKLRRIAIANLSQIL